MTEGAVKILLVDDSRSVHAYVSDILKESNVKFVHAYNGREAIDEAKKVGASLQAVLLDWEMPEMSGIEALPQLSSLLSQIPIFMMTSKNAMSDISEALGKGAIDYILKPFSKDILIDKLGDVIGGGRS